MYCLWISFRYEESVGYMVWITANAMIFPHLFDFCCVVGKCAYVWESEGGIWRSFQWKSSTYIEQSIEKFGKFPSTFYVFLFILCFIFLQLLYYVHCCDCNFSSESISSKSVYVWEKKIWCGLPSSYFNVVSFRRFLIF